MLCSRCKKREAKIYYTEITGGQKKEEYLCEECAEEYTSFQGSPQNLGGFLSSILSNYYGEQMENQPKPEAAVSCPVCGMTSTELMKTGKAGCSNCYQVFGKNLLKAIKQLQGADSHKGKRPKNMVPDTGKIPDSITRIEKLEILLQEAVEKEEFEEAARLRDEIRALKSEEAARAEKTADSSGQKDVLNKEA